jgi:hypothetical protein
VYKLHFRSTSKKNNMKGVLVLVFVALVARAQVIRYMDLYNGAGCVPASFFGWSQQAVLTGVPCQSLRFFSAPPQGWMTLFINDFVVTFCERLSGTSSNGWPLDLGWWLH